MVYREFYSKIVSLHQLTLTIMVETSKFCNTVTLCFFSLGCSVDMNECIFNPFCSNVYYSLADWSKMMSLGYRVAVALTQIKAPLKEQMVTSYIQYINTSLHVTVQNTCIFIFPADWHIG